MLRSLSALALLLLLALPGVALAQGTGTLAGVVTDDTGETLPLANVKIDGTTLGAATNMDGEYRIIGVPVGTYSVTASFTGFQAQTQTGIDVNAGLTRDVNFELGTTALEEITVAYERPLIENDAIGAPRVVSGEDIVNLPVRGVASVASLQGGVVSDDASGNLNIRGGRDEEVAYFVDGVRVIGGAPAVAQQAIQEQEMLIGTIPARYGDVQGGVISITTKTARDDFFGSIEGITSRGLDSYGYNLAGLSLGGPIIPGRMTFFASGQGTFLDDENPYGIDTYRLSDDAFAALSANPQVVRLINGDGETQYVPLPLDAIGSDDRADIDEIEEALAGQIPAGFEIDRTRAVVNAVETFTEEDFELAAGKENAFEELALNGNLNFTISPTISFRLGGAYERSRDDERGFTNLLYNQDSFLQAERDTWRTYGTLRQRFGNAAFYELRGEYQDFRFRRYPNQFTGAEEELLQYGDIDSDYNAIARNYYSYNAQTGSLSRLYTADGGLRPNDFAGAFNLPGNRSTLFQKAHDQQFRISASVTNQIGVHQLEIGGEFEKETRRFFSIGARSLARFAADGNVEGSVAGLPENGVTSYDQLPFEALRPATGARYGYDYLGLNEVNDQDIDAYFTRDENGLRGNTNVAPYEPLYYAGYIADKIEFQDLVIQLGLRVDAFDNNSPVLLDTYAPVPIVRAGDRDDSPSSVESDYAVYFNDTGTTVVGYRDLEGNFYDTDGTRVREDVITGERSGQVLETDDPISTAFTDYETQFTVMPRVGVSFPVTDRALFFASYNVTSQRPTENAFAPFTSFEELTGQDSRVSNPFLEPERTTQYELGFRQRLGERAALTLSGFYRTQENKISNQLLNGGFPAYGTYLNTDFTTTSGAEVGFDLRRTNNLALTGNYTLSFAQGTGSSSASTSTVVWRGEFFPNFITPADFDQRHTANFTADYRFGQGEGPLVGGVRLLENFGVNLLGQFGSGQRYTILESDGIRRVDASFTPDASGEINSGTLPATSRLDLRVDRSFDLGFAGSRLKAYVWIQNLLDTRNTLAVYRATGQAGYDGYLDTVAGQGELNGAVERDALEFAYNTYINSPVNVGGQQSSSAGLFYSPPRRVRLGFLFDF